MATGMPGWQRAAMGMQAFDGGNYPPQAIPQVMSREQEIEMLKAQAEFLQKQVEAVHERLRETQKESKNK